MGRVRCPHRLQHGQQIAGADDAGIQVAALRFDIRQQAIEHPFALGFRHEAKRQRQHVGRLEIPLFIRHAVGPRLRIKPPGVKSRANRCPQAAVMRSRVGFAQ